MNSPSSTDRLADGASLCVPADAVTDDVVVGLVQRLHELESERLAAREPGGWPFAIAMIDADRLLARADTAEEWLGRVEGKRRELETALQSQLTGFGRVKPIVVAAAKQAPALAGVPVDETGGVGVVNLAHTVSEHRSHYQNVRRNATRRLIVFALMSLLSCIVLIVGIVAAIRWAGPLTDNRLAERVRGYQLRERPTANRLSDARRPRVKAELQSIRDDVAYPILDPDLKAFVDERWRELDQYDRYAAQFKPPQPGTDDCRSLEELDRLAADLRGRLAPPAEYAEAWRDTEALRLRQKWAMEIDALRAAEATLAAWYGERIQQLHSLVLSTSLDRDWVGKVRVAFADLDTPPLDPDQPLTASPELPVPGGERLRMAVAHEFDRVDAGRRELDAARGRLTRLRTLVSLLGLAGDPDEACLDISPATPIRERLARLVELHADVATDPTSYALSQWGDPNRDVLKARLERSRDRLLTSIHDRVKSSVLSGGSETLAGWQAWSAKATESLADEARMFAILETLLTGTADRIEPVNELVSAVRQPAWTIPLERITVSWPDTWKIQPRQIEISLDDRTTTIPLAGEPSVERGMVIGRFESTVKSLTIPMGAKVTIKLQAGDAVLEWDRRPSAVMPWDVWAREPVIIRPGMNVSRVSGVTVRILPANRWPTRPQFAPDFAAGR